MAATPTALIERKSGSSWTTAYPQVTPNGVSSSQGQRLDLLQIVSVGEPGSTPKTPTVLLNVDYNGVVHNPASGATNGVRVGQYKTTRSSGTTAQLFANAFTNLSRLDILQVIAVGGNIAKYIDYLGVAH